MKSLNEVTQEKCFYCEQADQRKELADLLEKNPHLESHQEDPPLRDERDLYSVTGLATEMMTPSVWVWHQQQWHHYHPQDFPDTTLLRKFGADQTAGEITADDDMIHELTEHGGDPETWQCPEWTLALLGVWAFNLIPDQITLNREALNREQAMIAGKARTLDQLGFRKATILLREAPELIGECRCGKNDEDYLDQSNKLFWESAGRAKKPTG